ncbi:MAG: cyclic nucleotide-binding domain-containing protein [Deltaproteobacteria bacterium]|nr:cyclic nucleotide-binding domain-containing protein [Deltaproteobacteria bacterium]
MEEIAQDLAEHPFVQALTKSHLEWLAKCATARSFRAGQFLLREGGEADSLYLLRRGRVSLEVNVPGRGIEQVESLREGDIAGLSWLFPPHRWQLDARALEPVDCIALDARCLRAKMDEDHELAWALGRGLLLEMYQRLGRVRLQRLDLYAAESRRTP